MSDNPFQSPENLDQTGSSKVEPTAKVPVSVTVFGVLHLVFGVLGVCGAIFGVAGLVIENMNLPDQPANAVAEVMNKSVVFTTLTRLNIGFSFLITVLLIVAGISLLKKKKLGRKLSNVYGIYGVVMPLITIFLFVVVFRSDLLPLTQKIENGPELAVGVITFWASIGGAVFGMIYPILVLIFLNRRVVKEALH